MTNSTARPDFVTPAHDITIQVATGFLETLGRGDMESLMTLWHDKGRLEFPFSPNAQAPVVGIDNLRSYFLGTKGYKKPRGFPIKAIYPGADPEWVIIEFHGDLTNTRTGKEYSNEYVVVVQVKDSKVILFREFFDSLKRANEEG
ncbi:nuclear transport factor 2 family protein [Roseobacter weihaiensis]|uniref:nuclear transport factor 2 family protein n=1 Tax=Roseobacter weihaiensis TaxID=2763262 RepID=UPI001D0B81D2|nr:nuclear transport factor 2 family protein [Roseobacter sp. H9]